MFTLENRVYIVTKFAAGGDLTKFCMKFGKLDDKTPNMDWLSEEQVRHIFKQIVLGVFDMHRQGLVHRDLKLLNIFLCDKSKTPRVKIGDLGDAILLRPREKIVSKLGTIGFMAPEVMLSKPCDFKSDVYSLGIILYFLVCAEPPFDAEQFDEQNCATLLKMEIPFLQPEWGYYDRSVKELVKSMLRSDPDQRYCIDKVLSHPWVA